VRSLDPVRADTSHTTRSWRLPTTEEVTDIRIEQLAEALEERTR
jgi:hypothetical protein